MISSLLLAFVLADIRTCACDVSKPETMQAVNCSLCREAEKQPADLRIFFLKDANPTKPNRTLALPRKHTPVGHSLSDLSDPERTALWMAAIEKGKSLWGDSWGIAYNGEERRTQCHAHVHIGKLNEGAEAQSAFIVVSSPAEIQMPKDGSGLWFHMVDGKLHVHAGEQVNETVLMR